MILTHLILDPKQLTHPKLSWVPSSPHPSLRQPCSRGSGASNRLATARIGSESVERQSGDLIDHIRDHELSHGRAAKPRGESFEFLGGQSC